MRLTFCGLLEPDSVAAGFTGQFADPEPDHPHGRVHRLTGGGVSVPPTVSPPLPWLPGSESVTGGGQGAALHRVGDPQSENSRGSRRGATRLHQLPGDAGAGPPSVTAQTSGLHS